ncbi:hypothetical protein C2S53_017917 [Perilla frutescens var. hirtella]|uniref:Ubiquitin-like protease family profile domain-containing protein n=1 Tax=Perilla frutescens var. hirtella TaxID=608512 RepID=A0AAD4J0M3_PERFH|nr:hypothetical protein C2S53_017917 [Perilla frutescens var. hirtella]
MRMLFKINDDIVEFGAKEFAVMTGLRLGGSTETPSTSAFHSEVFNNKKPLYFVDIEKKLEPAHKACQDGSETSYKLALLLVVYGILLVKDRTSKAITLEYLHMVDDGQRFNNFPWGKVTYEFLIKSMDQARSCLARAKRKEGRRAIDVHGFLYPIQAWLYEIMPSIVNCYAVSIGTAGNMFPRMLRWCVPKTMTTVYDEVRPFFSKKNRETKRPLEMSAEEEPRLLDLGLHDFEESIKSLRDALDDYGSSDDCLDSSDDEISAEKGNVKGKRKMDGTMTSPWSRPGKRTRSSQSEDSMSHDLARLCANSNEMLLVMRDLCSNVARMADNMAAMQLDLHQLVKGKHWDARADLFGAGAGGNEAALQPPTEGVKHDGGASAHAESTRDESVSHSFGEVLKNPGETQSQSEGEEEALWDDRESSVDTESEASDDTCSPREGGGTLNTDMESSVHSKTEDDDEAIPQQERDDKEEDDDKDDEDSSAETEAEDSNESSSLMEEAGESETSFASSGEERREKDVVMKDVGESSSHQAADGVGLDSQPADKNADRDDIWDVTLSQFLDMGKAKAARASESIAEAAAEGPSQPTGKGASNMEAIVDAAMADWAENPIVAPNRHDPSITDPVSNPRLEEFKRWYNEQRKLAYSSQTEVKLPNHDLFLTTAPCFDGLCKRYGWLTTTHIDALLNLILSKVKHAPETFADNWAVLETYLWGTLQTGETNFAVETLVPYSLETSPKMLKRQWAKVEKVYGIGNVNDDHWVCYAIDLNQQSITVYDSQFQAKRWDDVRRQFTTIARYIPSACKRAGLWKKCQPPAATLLDQWTVVSNEDTPQQTNSHDCGVMTLKILECLCAGVPIHVINPAKCGRYRNDLTAALFQLTKELGEEAANQGRAAEAAFATMNRRTRRGSQQ